jgi:NAD-dependent SIR2 family protein deacetylase
MPDGRGRRVPSVKNTQNGLHEPFCVLVDLLAGGGAAVLSGAGLSTDSGIPDYRGPTGLARQAALGRQSTPMTYQAFTGSAAARQRYWARSHLGWQHIARARPNAGHYAVAELSRSGLLTGVITQNVDGLHQAAGADEVTELHGSLYRVACLACGERTSRVALDARLRAANPGWAASAEGMKPDGDAEVSEEAIASFAVVDCLTCGGVLKPDVVFFGENVPPGRVAFCYDLVAGSRSLIVLGSSLTVMSGLRYVRHAAKLGLPVAIVNQGTTRGDEFAAVTLDAPLGPTLARCIAELHGMDDGEDVTAALPAARSPGGRQQAADQEAPGRGDDDHRLTPFHGAGHRVFEGVSRDAGRHGAGLDQGQGGGA